MFSEEIFIQECVSYLLTKYYANSDYIKSDIRLYIETNVPSNFIHNIEYLCERIFDEYMENYFGDISSIEDTDDEDDILYRAAEIWLTADANFTIV